MDKALSPAPSLAIVGAGLAGCTLAWQLYFRGHPFCLFDRKNPRGSSLVAPGLLSPVAGKAFNPSWRINEFLAPMQEFYARVEAKLRTTLWLDLPVHRLFSSAAQRAQFEQKRHLLSRWTQSESSPRTRPYFAPHGGVRWAESGRLDLRHYICESQRFFEQIGQLKRLGDSLFLPESEDRSPRVYTTGAEGLINQSPLTLEHRCAKGEILTVRIGGLPQDEILSRNGGWLVPTGKKDETFSAGAGYEWNDLTFTPTPAGRQKAEEIIKDFTPLSYEVLAHEAAIRPIVRRSEPLIGEVSEGQYLFNALGSKGVLYAPYAAQQLCAHLLSGHEIDPPLDLKSYLKTSL